MELVVTGIRIQVRTVVSLACYQWAIPLSPLVSGRKPLNNLLGFKENIGSQTWSARCTEFVFFREKYEY